MELHREILISSLKDEKINILFPNIKVNATELVEMKCYKSLQKIKAIIENDSLDDFECIEKIVCVLEEIGSNGGNRHDFG